MSDIQDEKLEALLRSRRLEAASADLAEQIILKAQTIPQNPSISLIEWIRSTFDEFRLPRPAYVLAATLLVGIAIGFSMSPGTVSPTRRDAVQVGFLYDDEGML